MGGLLRRSGDGGDIALSPALSQALTRRKAGPYVSPAPMPDAQVAELVDALVSGTSGESRGGSSPLLGTILSSSSWLGAQDTAEARSCHWAMIAKSDLI